MLEGKVKCLSTRKHATGAVVRRYQMDDGSRMSTVEIPVVVFRGLGSRFLKDRMAAAAHGREIRAAAAARKRLVVKLAAEGKNNCEIAREVVCTEARVRQILKETRLEFREFRHTDSDIVGAQRHDNL